MTWRPTVLRFCMLGPTTLRKARRGSLTSCRHTGCWQNKLQSGHHRTHTSDNYMHRAGVARPERGSNHGPRDVAVCVHSCRPGECAMTPVLLGDHDEMGGCWPQCDTGFFLLRNLIQRSASGRRRVATASRRGSQRGYNDEPTRLTATACAGQTTNYNDEIRKRAE